MLYQTRNWSFGGGSVTPAVKFLLIVNTAVFILQIFLDHYITWLFGLVPYSVWRDYYLWQLFTYQFLHGGLMHLLFNMLAVWMFGCDLERRWGSEFFLKYYFVSVIGGGLLNAPLMPDKTVPSIGGSAGVCGVPLGYRLFCNNNRSAIH